MTYEELVAELKRRGLSHAVDSLTQEMGKEWERGSTKTVKETNRMMAQLWFADTIGKLIEEQPTNVSESGYKWELAKSIADAMKKKKQEVGVKVAPPTPLDALDRAVMDAGRLKIDYDEGEFAARVGDTVADGKTVLDALAALSSKLSKDHRSTTPAPQVEKEVTTQYANRQ